MQFQRGEIRQPYERRQVIRQNVVDRPPVVTAPDRCGLHPVGLVHWRILFEERLALDPVGITFARKRSPVEMRQDGRRNPRVVVDHVLLGKAGCGVKDLLQVRDLKVPALDIDGRVCHMRSIMSFCLSATQPQNTGLILIGCPDSGWGCLTTWLPATYFQTSALLARPPYGFR